MSDRVMVRMGDWMPDEERCFWCRARVGDAIMRSNTSRMHYLVARADGQYAHFPTGNLYRSLSHAGRRLYGELEKIELVDLGDDKGGQLCRSCFRRYSEWREENARKKAERSSNKGAYPGRRRKKQKPTADEQIAVGWREEDFK
jgi:hypothetical protein